MWDNYIVYDTNDRLVGIFTTIRKARKAALPGFRIIHEISKAGLGDGTEFREEVK